MQLQFVYKNREILSQLDMGVSVDESTGTISYSGGADSSIVSVIVETIHHYTEFEFVDNVNVVFHRLGAWDTSNDYASYNDKVFNNACDFYRIVDPEPPRQTYYYVSSISGSFISTSNLEKLTIINTEFHQVSSGTSTYNSTNQYAYYEREDNPTYEASSITWQSSITVSGHNYKLVSGQGTNNAKYVEYGDEPQKYDIAEGMTLTRNYNETLDSATIIVSHLDKEIDIEPYDEVKLLGFPNEDTIYMCVDEYTCQEIRNKTGDKYYRYEIKLFSQTKLLENVVLPSLAITPKTSDFIGTPTIMRYLERYNNLFGQKVRTASGFANKFNFSDRCYDKFNVECPELQFNTPTFRECLTQLMMVKDCIPVVKNNVIDYIDISAKRDEIVNAPINYIQKSQSSTDYVSELKMNIKNTIQDEEYIDCVEYTGIRNNDKAIIDTDNMFIYTQHPIYNINKITICFLGRAAGTISGGYGSKQMYVEKDITDLVVEKAKWDTLNVVSTLSNHNYNDFKNYQNSTLYYTRGNNVIDNLSGKTRVGFLIQDIYSTLQWIASGMCAKVWHEDLGLPIEDIDSGPANTTIQSWDNIRFFENVSFKIEYQTKADIVARVGKGDKQTTPRETVDNQSNNYTNAFTQGLLEYAKANRLGNVIKNIYARYTTDYTNLIKEGGYQNDDIVYQVEYQIYKNYINVIANACPNYILRNYFTGVQSKLRSWKIVDTNEAFYREENYKIYCEFSYTQYSDSFGEIDFGTHKFDFLRCLIGSMGLDSALDYSISVTNLININPIPDGTWTDNFVLERAINVVGYSVILTFGYEDNYQIAKYNTLDKVSGGSKQQMYSYTSANANYINTKISFIKNKNVFGSSLPEINRFISVDYTPTTWQFYYTKVANMPLQQYDSYDKYAELTIGHNKDNKEIIKQNLQFEYCVDNNEIIISEEFMKSLPHNYDRNTLKIRLSDTPTDRFNKEIVPSGSDYGIANLVFGTFTELDKISLLLKINNISVGNKYVYIYNTETNKTLLAWKGDTLYLNLLKDRNKDTYVRDGDDWKKV